MALAVSKVMPDAQDVDARLEWVGEEDMRDFAVARAAQVSAQRRSRLW